MLGNPLRGSVGWAAVGRTGAERSGRRRVWEGEGVPCHALPRLHPGGWRRTRRRSQVRQVQAEPEWSMGSWLPFPGGGSWSGDNRGGHWQGVKSSCLGR